MKKTRPPALQPCSAFRWTTAPSAGLLVLQVGTFEQEPQKIAGIVRSWVQEKRVEFDEMAARAKQIAQPDALFRIVRDLAAMCTA